MASASAPSDLSSGVSKLSVNPSATTVKTTKAKATKTVADSWEDEDVSDSESESRPRIADFGLDGTADGTAAPPPTPISPTYSKSRPFSPGSGSPITSDGSLATDLSGISGPRPEKTDAVARRMIAGALGMRMPRQTEEQKAYDRALRENERKRREGEKAAEKQRQEEVEKAKAAIWND